VFLFLFYCLKFLEFMICEFFIYLFSLEQMSSCGCCEFAIGGFWVKFGFLLRDRRFLSG